MKMHYVFIFKLVKN